LRSGAGLKISPVRKVSITAYSEIADRQIVYADESLQRLPAIRKLASML
jgi:hypothetical protein